MANASRVVTAAEPVLVKTERRLTRREKVAMGGRARSDMA
jgi:hypothetical protein